MFWSRLLSLSNNKELFYMYVQYIYIYTHIFIYIYCFYICISVFHHDVKNKICVIQMSIIYLIYHVSMILISKQYRSVGILHVVHRFFFIGLKSTIEDTYVCYAFFQVRIKNPSQKGEKLK